jgi:hypothetical protein
MENVKYTIVNTNGQTVTYNDGSQAMFDSAGRLLEWKGICSFQTLNLSPEEAKHTYKMLILFWDTHTDPMHRTLEWHHEIPLFALKNELGESTTRNIRGGSMDRGRLVSLPTLAHMRAHFYLMLAYNNTEFFDDSRAAFEMLSGRQGTSISDQAKIELYDMKQQAKLLRAGHDNTIALSEYYFTKFDGKDFSGRNLTGTSFHGCTFQNCNFKDAIMDFCDLTFTIFRNCNLDNCRMDTADTRGMRQV